MHLRRAASQQVDESRVEGHDGISQVHPVLLVLLLTSKPTRKKKVALHTAATTMLEDIMHVGLVKYHQTAFKPKLRALTWESVCLS